MTREVYKVNTQRAKETKQRLQEESQKNLLPMWKIPEGASKIRILPPWSEAGDIAFESRSHWKIPPNDKMYNCLRVINKECAICEMVKDLRSRGKHDIANKFSAKKSIYYNIIVRGEEEKGVQIMRSGVKLYESILSYLYDEDYAGLTDIDAGRDFTIERSGQGLDTSYDLRVSPKETTLSDDKKQAQKWIDGMFELDQIMDFKDGLELTEVVGKITGNRDTTVTEDEPALIEATTSETVNVTNVVEPVKEPVKETDKVSNEDKKANLLKELETLV